MSLIQKPWNILHVMDIACQSSTFFRIIHVELDVLRLNVIAQLKTLERYGLFLEMFLRSANGPTYYEHQGKEMTL